MIGLDKVIRSGTMIRLNRYMQIKVYQNLTSCVCYLKITNTLLRSNKKT